MDSIQICWRILLVVLAVNAGSFAQSPVSGPAQQRVQQVIDVINSGDRNAARNFIKQNFASMASGPNSSDGPINTFSYLHDMTRGMELQSVREPKPGSVNAMVRSKLTGQWRELMIELESAAPHRIKKFDWASRPTPADAQGSQRLTEPETVAQLDGFIQKLAGADLFSGVAVLAKGDKILFAKAVGEANKDFGIPNRVDTKFNLASLNKMFTSVAVAQLVEQGKLSYDDPLSKFLPDYPTREAAEKIRIKHLLTHTSGLGSYDVAASRKSARTVDEFLKLGGDKLAFEPGTDQAYSNTAFLVAGKVIEKVSGQSYYDYVREHIYRRAGMANTDAYDLDLVTKNLAVGYEKSYSDSGVVFKNNVCSVGHGGPAGGGFSTGEDLMRFASALRSGKLVGDAYVKTILSPKPELKSPTYGYGFNVLNGIAGHNGGDTGVNTSMEMFLEEGYTIVILANYGGSMVQVKSKLRELLLAGKPVR